MTRSYGRAPVDCASGKQAPNRNKLYGRRWQKARLMFLTANPLCVYCARQGRATAATVVDHRQPHRGDPSLFWDVSNWQPLCAPHHNSTKQIEERQTNAGSDINGLPIDPNHHWNTVKMPASAPSREEREQWCRALGHVIVHEINIPIEVCKDRILQDGVEA